MITPRISEHELQILRSTDQNGVFSVIDCEWPHVVNLIRQDLLTLRGPYTADLTGYAKALLAERERIATEIMNREQRRR